MFNRRFNMPNSVSETITENLFRDYYGPSKFIEKSAIPKQHGFKSKSGTSYKGYPDFFWIALIMQLLSRQKHKNIKTL